MKSRRRRCHAIVVTRIGQSIELHKKHTARQKVPLLESFHHKRPEELQPPRPSPAHLAPVIEAPHDGARFEKMGHPPPANLRPQAAIALIQGTQARMPKMSVSTLKVKEKSLTFESQVAVAILAVGPRF